MVIQPDGKIVVTGYTVHSLLLMRYLPDGTLDMTFGDAGIATFKPTAFDVVGNAVAIQADGKIVVAGFFKTQPTDFVLARVTASGALDTSFGIDGWVTTDFDYDGDQAEAILIQPDGKIVAAGLAVDGGDVDFAVARYNSNGSLDTAFSGDGKVTIGFGSGEWGRDIALQEDGKLIVVGAHITGDYTEDFAVVRLNGDGSLDSSFDGDGRLTTAFGGDEEGHAIILQPDGKIVVAGDDYYSVRVARYLPNGVLDNTLDGDGKLSIGSLSGGLRDVAWQPDGKIVLLGRHISPDLDRKFAFYRLNPDGTLDASFGLDGRIYLDTGADDRGNALALFADGRILASGMSDSNHVIVRLWPDGSLDGGAQQTLGFEHPLLGPGSQEILTDMALQPDGKIVLTGHVANTGFTQRDFAVARFLPDGLPDTSFGQMGQVSFGFGGQEFGTSVVLQPDGKTVVGGFVDTGSDFNFMVARFNPDGAPDTSFNFFGFNVLDFLGGFDRLLDMALAPDGKIVVAGTVYNGARNVFGVARFNSDGTVDTSFDVDGKQLFEFDPSLAHDAYAIVVQPDHKIVVAGLVGTDFGLVRFNENGSVDATFGSDGKTITSLGGYEYITALHRNDDGSFLASGVHGMDFALVRYTPNGSVDLAFGTGGLALADLGGDDFAAALDVRGDGAILLAGCSGSTFAVAQFLPDGQLDTAFNGTGYATTDFVGEAECAKGVKFTGLNKFIAAGEQVVGGNFNMTLARFETTVDASNADEAIQGLVATNSSPNLIGQATVLTATVSMGTNVSYAWDFGDGQNGSGATVSHIYPVAGNYTAVVTATNTIGSMTATTVVTVEAETMHLYLPTVLRP